MVGYVSLYGKIRVYAEGIVTFDKTKLLAYLRANIDDQKRVTIRRVIAINLILHLFLVIFLLFALYNYLFTQLYLVSILDIFAAFGILFSLVDLHTTKSIKRAAAIATIIAMLFLLTFIFINGADHFGLIWIVYLPIFAIIANGRKTGALLSVFFLSFVFTTAYQNIDIWNFGYWNELDFFRLVFATTVLTYTFYVLEYAQEKSDEAIDEIRRKEQRINEQLRKLSITDSLTQLYNHRFFDENMPKLLNLAKREKMCFTFFILDIDNFKGYNDTYGHQRGNEALQRIAAAMKSHIQRESDYVFRLGGEEFGGAILTYSQRQAQEHIAKLCDVVRNLNIEHEASAHPDKIATVSIGICSIEPSNDETINDIFKEADKELYRAKAEGKDRASISDRCSSRAQFA